MKEFEEIASCGGIITFKDGQPTYSTSYPTPAIVDLIEVDLNGSLFTVMLPGDKENHFGCSCHRCNRYFRTTYTGSKILCPYCLNVEDRTYFLTANQKQYISLYINRYIESIDGGNPAPIDLHQITSELNDNVNKLKLSEERQQLHRECNKGHNLVKFDTLGIYSSCPLCGSRNTLVHFNDILSSLEEQSANSIIQPDNALNQAIETFSSMGKDLRYIIKMNIKNLQNDREIQSIDFQKIDLTAKILKSKLKIEIFSSISEEDKSFLIRMFQSRHLIAHNGGVVDEQFLKKIPSSTERLGQKIKITHIELERIVQILKKCSNEFVNEIYKEITKTLLMHQ